MRLRSTDGTEIDLRPARYQYPRIRVDEPGDWDANWLVIRGEVRPTDGRHWRFEDACLTTWDAADFARWLRRVTADEVTVTPLPAHRGQLLRFTEPNLAFSLAATEEGRRAIRVHFSLEARPRWASPPGDDVDLYGFFVTVESTVAELARAVEEWERERALYPPR